VNQRSAAPGPASLPPTLQQVSVILEVNGQRQEIPNDYVWIFAGGEPPTAFLKKIGVRIGMQDMTSTGSKEAKEVRQTSLSTN
jgi:thioredoxin reductase